MTGEKTKISMLICVVSILRCNSYRSIRHPENTDFKF